MLDLTNLIGFGAGGVSSLSFVDSASANSVNITIPATARAGDVAVLFDAPNGSSNSMVLPTGWTYIRQDTEVSSNHRLQTSYKILTASDPGASITGSDGSVGDRKIMFVFRPDAPVVTVTVSAVNWQYAAGGDPSQQTISSSSGRAPLVALAGYRAESAITTDSFSPAEDGEVDSSVVIAKYKIYNGSPSDITVDMGDHGDHNSLTSFYLQVA